MLKNVVCGFGLRKALKKAPTEAKKEFRRGLEAIDREFTALIESFRPEAAFADEWADTYIGAAIRRMAAHSNGTVTSEDVWEAYRAVWADKRDARWAAARGGRA